MERTSTQLRRCDHERGSCGVGNGQHLDTADYKLSSVFIVMVAALAIRCLCLHIHINIVIIIYSYSIVCFYIYV